MHIPLGHPCDEVLSRREFFVQSVDRKYGGGGPRCC
ncbi:CstA-like transporter-associated (seleno)protein [Cupriavidus necator]|nr:CstA-like transporter-associated (seleno)protein [Cupriavidus necator]